MRGFFSKVDKLVGSLALLIYTIESYRKKGDGIIPLSVLDRAIEISKYFIGQAIEARNIKAIIETKQEIEFEKKRDRALRHVSRLHLPASLREVCRTLHMPVNEVTQYIEPYYNITREGRKKLITSQKRT